MTLEAVEQAWIPNLGCFRRRLTYRMSAENVIEDG
jgi:hypothetical protein